ncbi:hypothetical protein CSW98_06730 [Vibrio sp. HA2012]|uniref:ABC transporter substrate-binding protein n=1 Tax=Vibrio sp. HA2012 TaxID=1971595 RepID=UPI000C2BC5A6|nr:ABC transporter substrate-binding protein [Vibrio sp. HA2012]PJC86683.1 hypothetical protein CSW98_06730 [Vibrio sp. HA2012]
MMKYWFMLGIALVSSVLQAKPVTDNERLIIADEKGDWGYLAPYLHSPKGPGYVYTSFIYDTLVWKNTEGNLVPMLATEWNQLSDKHCYQLSMNHDAKWHDGKKVTGEDVVFTFHYMQKHFYQFADLTNISHISNKNGTLDICTKEVDAFFMERVAGVLPILPKHVYDHIGDPVYIKDHANLVGSGPYKVKLYNKNQGIYHLERNDDWYMGKSIYKDIIITKLSMQSAVNAIKKGDIDIINIPYGYIDKFNSNNVDVISSLSNHPYRILFNHSGLLSNKKFRQALAYSMDKKLLVDLAYEGHAEVARPGFYPTGNIDGLNEYAFNLEQATKLLIDAGLHKKEDDHWYDKNNTLISLSLVASTQAELLSKIVSKNLNDIGFPVSLKLMPDASLQERLSKNEFDLALLTQSHQGDYDRFRIMLHGKQKTGDHYYSNPDLNSILEKLRFSDDKKASNKLMLKAEQIYNEDLPSYPLVNPYNYSAVRKGISVNYTEGGIATGIPMIFNKLALFLKK